MLQATSLPKSTEPPEANFWRLAANPWAWLTEVGKVNDPPPGLGLIPFQPWPHLRRVVQAIERNDKLLIGKARRLGLTWLLAGYGVHTAQYREGARVLYFSKGEAEAAELISRGRVIWANQPVHLKLSLGRDGATFLSFPVMGSSIKALPATEDAGRGEDASLVIVDEADYHPYAKENYGAIKPAVDRPGSKIVFVSTFNRLRVDTFFKELWRGAPGNGWTTLFLPWDCRPGRGGGWYEVEKASYPDPFQFEKENPGNEAEALAPSREACFFDISLIVRLLETAREGEVFKPYQAGHRYAAWMDPAGEGADRFSLAIRDCHTGEYVVDYTIPGPVEVFAEHAYGLLKDFRFPLLGIEATGVGLATVTLLKGLNYPPDHLIYRDEKREKVGVAPNRAFQALIWAELAVEFRQGGIVIYSKPALNEMMHCIQDPQTGRVAAARGSHDDRPSAMAGAGWVSRQVGIRVGRPQSKHRNVF